MIFLPKGGSWRRKQAEVVQHAQISEVSKEKKSPSRAAAILHASREAGKKPVSAMSGRCPRVIPK